MILRFRQVRRDSRCGRCGPISPEGILSALVRTVGGLIVAIPALAASGDLAGTVESIVGGDPFSCRAVTLAVAAAEAPRAAALGKPHADSPVRNWYARPPRPMQGTESHAGGGRVFRLPPRYRRIVGSPPIQFKPHQPKLPRSRSRKSK